MGYVFVELPCILMQVSVHAQQHIHVLLLLLLHAVHHAHRRLMFCDMKLVNIMISIMITCQRICMDP